MSHVRIIPNPEAGELLYVQCTGCRAVYHPGFTQATCECETPEASYIPWDPGLDTSGISLPEMLMELIGEIEQAGLHLDKESGSLWSAYVDALCYLARTTTVGRYFWREE